MKTKEFIKRVEDLGYSVSVMSAVFVKGNKGRVATISRANKNRLDLWVDDYEISDELFDLCVEYAKTPIEDREEEKKYTVKDRTTAQYLTTEPKWVSVFIEQLINKDSFLQHTLKELEDLGIDVEHYDLEEIE